jgi:hypothetical protein
MTIADRLPREQAIMPQDKGHPAFGFYKGRTMKYHGASGWEARNREQQGRLAAAGRTYDGHGIPEAKIKIDIFENDLCLIVILKRFAKSQDGEERLDVLHDHPSTTDIWFISVL